MGERLSSKTDYNKYEYVSANAFKVRVLYALGIICWTLTVYGFIRFFNLNIAYWIFFGPVIALLTLHNFLNYGIQLFYKKFDLRKHESLKSKFWKNLKREPEIDILLPVCGEDLQILQNTFEKVKGIKYKNKKVYVLDDKGEAQVKKLATKLGFTYLSRPNKGYMKKAGNLMYGYKHCKGEFIAVFDADFAPHPDFVIELLPYMEDKKTGIVQSTHFFGINKKVHDRSEIEYGSANLQEQFYLTIQPARDRFGAAICAGSNTIYRKAALDKIGGPAQVDHGEDVNTGLDLINVGYRVKYVPITVAIGLSPHTLQQFYKQQNRWSSSSMGMLLTGKIFNDKLTIPQRLCYLSGITYYLSQMAYFILPIQLFLVLGLHADSITFAQAIPFIPYMVYSIVILPLMSRKSPPRLGTYVATISTLYVHTYTVILRFFGRPATWVPTNAITHGVERGFEILNEFSLLFISIYVIGIAVLIYTWHFPIFNFAFITIMFWLIYGLVFHSIYSIRHYAVVYKYRAKNALSSSSERNDFNLWRMRTFGTVGFATVLLVGSSGYSLQTTHAQVLYATRTVILARLNSKTEERPTKVIVAKVVESIPKKVVLGTKTNSQELVIEAKYGDSDTSLARKAVLQYGGGQLNDVERAYIETHLAKEYYREHLGVGDKIVFRNDDIKKYIDESEHLTSYEQKAWQHWADTVDWNNY